MYHHPHQGAPDLIERLLPRSMKSAYRPTWFKLKQRQAESKREVEKNVGCRDLSRAARKHF